MYCDVAIVGAGPAGIGAAVALDKAGIKDVVVFEREPRAGGIPRHIHHPTFGLLVFKRPMAGPRFIEKILARCQGVRFEFETSVMGIKPAGFFNIAGPEGIKTVRARHIIIATGAREKPRHPRLVSGLRPQGIMTTGALQKLVYGENLTPFERPVIVGSELVSFSALATLGSAGAKAVAMIEQNPRISAYRPAIGFSALMGTPIHYNSKIVDIGGKDQVEFVTIDGPKGKRRIDCDGVIFSGDFVGETALTRTSHLANDGVSQLPLVDASWVSSDENISVIGNCVHPADMGDQCYLEGLKAGAHVGEKLGGTSREDKGVFVSISHDARIKMLAPGALRMKSGQSVRLDISLHVLSPFTGRIVVLQDGEVIYKKYHRCQPARRIVLRGVGFQQAGFEQESSPLPVIEVKLG
ncbi:MAG TPA: FAD-binding protein [Devosia sp.]|nr:FAD-binding protein [Devosia sp.]